MNIQNQLRTLQGVLTDRKSASVMASLLKDPMVVGRFENREAQFGVRRVSGKKEIFFQVRLQEVVALPFWLKTNCPLKTDEALRRMRMDLAIEHARWLTAYVRLRREPEEDALAFLQTEESVRQLLNLLTQRAHRIESGEYSVQQNVLDFQRTGVRDFFKTLALSIILIVALFAGLAILAFSAKKAFMWEKKILQKQPGMQGGACPKEQLILSHQSIFLKATADKMSVGIGEEVTLTYHLFTRYETRYWGLHQEGDFQGFEIATKEDKINSARQIVDYEGKKYAKSKVMTVSLIPLRAGKKTVYPGIGFVSVKKRSGEIVDMYLPIEPLEITVQS